MNAASCVLEPRYPWCDIYLATTENTPAQSTLVGSLKSVPGSSDPQALRAILIPMFEQFVSSSPQTSPELYEVRKNDAGVIGAVIDKNYEQIVVCIQNFDKREPVSQEMPDARCSVGQESKWLRIILLVEGRTYIFLFSPNA
ncbi:hypothetical protein [Neomesorhizobium albiziae]|nr:hypothetical protein [Mesorhizobium albiziae]